MILPPKAQCFSENRKTRCDKCKKIKRTRFMADYHGLILCSCCKPNKISITPKKFFLEPSNRLEMIIFDNSDNLNNKQEVK